MPTTLKISRAALPQSTLKMVQGHYMFVVYSWYAFGGAGSLRLAHTKDPVGDTETFSMTDLDKLVGARVQSEASRFVDLVWCRDLRSCSKAE